MFLDRILETLWEFPATFFLKRGSEGPVEVKEGTSACHGYSFRSLGFCADVLLQ